MQQKLIQMQLWQKFGVWYNRMRIIISECNHPSTVHTTITMPNINEWKEIKALRLEALKNEPHAFKNYYHDEIMLSDNQWREKISNSCEDNSHEFFIIAKNAEGMIGIVGAEKLDNEMWYLKSVYIKTEYRGKGIGLQLLDRMMWKLDHEYGASMVRLKVNARQKAAIRLYKKCGFIIENAIEKQQSGDGNLYTKFIMHRNQCVIR